MKVAVATNNGLTVSAHYGRSKYFAVYTVEEGKIISKELREKPVHYGKGQGIEHGSEHHHESGGHGNHGKHHEEILNIISDCDAVITRGIGPGAYRHLVAKGLKVLVVDEVDAERVVELYASGKLS